MRRALSVGLLLVATPVFAWESACRTYTTPTAQPAALAAAASEPCVPSAGPMAARQRWVGPLDEHRRLWELTRAQAGLPEATSATRLLQVFTGAGTVDVAGAELPSWAPVPFGEVARVVTRPFSVGELTQLPDFSYALWDWASGHESCPLEGASSLAECHDFAAHMGPVNSNHFVPQAREHYAHYHRLALGKAADCAAMKARLASAAGRFDGFLEDCGLEALALEAVGQHYLQDAWSMGHMWQRWGSSTLSDFPGATVEEKRDRAVLVALVAGLFHGARSVLQALPEWTTYDVNDAMCAPWDAVRFLQPGAGLVQGVGDNYLPLLAAEAPYEAQRTTFLRCAATGMLEVYRAAGEPQGAATPAAGLASVDPTSAECFGQRATNAALAQGAAINLKVAGLQVSVPLDARFTSFLLPKVARSQGKVEVPGRLRDEFRFELQRITTLARLRAKSDPDGTTLADGQWGPFLGVAQNGAYSGLAGYLDAPWPWDPASERTQVLRRTFHAAHAAEWCQTMDGPSLDALRARAQDPALDSATRAAACLACTEFSVRHLRVGSAAAWDVTREPLCHYLVEAPALVYHQAPGVSDPWAVAARWCCP